MPLDGCWSTSWCSEAGYGVDTLCSAFKWVGNYTHFPHMQFPPLTVHMAYVKEVHQPFLLHDTPNLKWSGEGLFGLLWKFMNVPIGSLGDRCRSGKCHRRKTVVPFPCAPHPQSKLGTMHVAFKEILYGAPGIVCCALHNVGFGVCINQMFYIRLQITLCVLILSPWKCSSR